LEDLKKEYLLPNTQKVLDKLIDFNFLSDFVLVGGSALALYLAHRKSEDLDFFTYCEGKFDKEKIKTIINNLNGEIVNISDEEIDAIIDGVKVTFFDSKWSFLKPKEIKKFNVATIEELAIMKTHTLFLRAKYRDYYDLYFLTKKLGIKKIYEISKDILSGLNFKLFASALIYIDDIEDENINHLDPKIKLSLKEIQHFFEKELKKL